MTRRHSYSVLLCAALAAAAASLSACNGPRVIHENPVLVTGEHAIVARLDGTAIPVGTVQVAPGTLGVATTRVWSAGATAAPPSD